MKFEISEEELDKIFREDIVKHIKTTLAEKNMAYWIRDKVHTLLAEEIIKEAVKKHFTDNEIRNLIKEAIKKHVDEKYDF